MPFVLFFLQTFKTPEVIILSLFWVVFQGLLSQMRSSLYKSFTIHNHGKFDQYRICDWQFINFQSFSYQFSIYGMVFLGRVFGA